MCAGVFSSVRNDILSERDLKADYNFSIPWLRRARRTRTGPPFLRLGKRMVRYRRADVEEFLARRLVETNREERPPPLG
jgi:predicted DNA-binding transcriptional regulator AlpA